MSPHALLASILAVVMTAPSIAALALLEYGRPGQAAAVLAIQCAAGVGLLPFIARFCLRVCVFRDLDRAVDFASKLRQGVFPEPFGLPLEQEDEHVLLRLKRNLNWMLHVLKDREKRLLWRLEEADQARRDLETISRTDPLTGLGNRRGFDGALAAWGKMSPCPLLCLLLIDCDKFKQVNDLHGHPAGDEVLRLLASVILDCVRAGQDAAFRLGGDEFAVLMACPADRAASAAGRIRERFRQFNGRGCTLSMGLCVREASPGSSDADWQALVAQADRAVYRAKSAGGDRLALG